MMILCVICNQDVTGDKWHEAVKSECLRVAIARAEAAEANAQTEFNQRIVEGLEFEHRIDLLESELAALRDGQGWRPVTDDWPPMREWVLGGNTGRHISTFEMVCLTVEEGEDVWMARDGLYKLGAITCALVVPAPPKDEES